MGELLPPASEDLLFMVVIRTESKGSATGTGVDLMEQGENSVIRVYPVGVR
jgi:hypothetical protein